MDKRQEAIKQVKENVLTLVTTKGISSIDDILKAAHGHLAMVEVLLPRGINTVIGGVPLPYEIMRGVLEAAAHANIPETDKAIVCGILDRYVAQESNIRSTEYRRFGEDISQECWNYWFPETK